MTKEQITDRVKRAFAALDKKGIRKEEIASTIGMSFNSVYNWSVGRRTPKLPVIRQIESSFGVKIL